MSTDGLASLDEVITSASAAWKPPPKLTLSQWADEYFRLSAENSAQPGRWKTLPYQREIMDCMSDPLVTSVSLMKSARIGYTLMISAAIGYYVHQDPCSILFVEPTVDDAKSFSKETIAPMIRDVPVLSAIMFDEAEEKGPRDSGNTIQGKSYPGGRLSLVGANSGAGFRRRSCRVAALDEVDAYPPSAGSDGDPVELATKRTEYFWNRKIFAGSTPLVAGLSRIEALFLAGDQRRYYVPCPHCGHMDHLVFTERETGGHWLHWEKDCPETAHFVCSKNGCVIGHEHKRDMVARGEWRAAGEFKGHASFHIWSAYSYSPNASWGQIAERFLKAKAGGRETLRTFINTELGETFTESGEAPDWERLYQRREDYDAGTVPDGVKFLTCGVDVQKDRWVYEVVGWSGREKETWSIDTGVIFGDTANADEWVKLDELLGRTYSSAAGVVFTIRMLAVDSGFNTQQVYGWTRGHDSRRVIAVKGVATAHTITDIATKVDVTIRGKRLARGARVFPVGSSVAKTELYGWLRLQPPLEAGGHHPPGFCHFPSGYGPEFFKQLTAEHLVSTVSKRGYKVLEWHVIPGRENHQLDCRVYARAAAAILGIDRMAPTVRVLPAVAKAAQPVPGPGRNMVGPDGKVFEAHEDPKQQALLERLGTRPAPAPPRVAPPIKPRPLSDSRFIGKRQPGWLSKRR